MKSVFEVQTDLNWVEFFSFVRFDYQTTTASTKITTRSKPLSSPSSHVNRVDQKIRAKLKKLEKSRLHQHISSKDKLPTRISFGHFAPGMLAKPKAFIFDTAIVKKCCQKWYIIWFNFDSNEMSIPGFHTVVGEGEESSKKSIKKPFIFKPRPPPPFPGLNRYTIFKIIHNFHMILDRNRSILTDEYEFVLQLA